MRVQGAVRAGQAQPGNSGGGREAGAAREPEGGEGAGAAEAPGPAEEQHSPRAAALVEEVPRLPLLATQRVR